MSFKCGESLSLVSDVGIGQSTDHVLAVEKSAEDLSFVTRQLIERTGKELVARTIHCKSKRAEGNSSSADRNRERADGRPSRFHSPFELYFSPPITDISTR